MKKMITFMMVMAMTFCFVACQKTETDDTYEKDTVKIEALNANKEMVDLEVPYNPERIAILDMPALDIVDALGVGDRVVGSAKVTIEYLTDYNPDDSDGAIMNLGTVKTADLERLQHAILILSLLAVALRLYMLIWRRLHLLFIWV